MTSPLNVHVLEPDAPAGPATPTLVFAHGYGCDQGMWADVVAGLPHTRRVLFDWPGAGGSRPEAYDPVRHATLEGYVPDLLQLLQGLSIPAPVVVGHSVGASIALLAARRAPSAFGTLALLCPSPCFADDPPDYVGGFERAQLEGLVESLAQGQQAWARAIAPLAMGNAEQPAHAARLEASFCAMDPDVALRWARATFLSDIRREVSQVRVPTWVLQSRQDPLAPLAVGQWLAATLPLATLEVLPVEGHCPHVSAPVTVVRALQRLLAAHV
jgi:sigma-B regulation protein RsbQ